MVEHKGELLAALAAAGRGAPIREQFKRDDVAERPPAELRRRNAEPPAILTAGAPPGRRCIASRLTKRLR